MSKERLEEFKDYIDFLDDSQDMQDHGRFVDTLHSLYEDGWFDWIFLYAIEQAERVQELEKKIEKESRVRKYLRNKNKLYLNTIRKAERLTDYEANVILRKALEGEE